MRALMVTIVIALLAYGGYWFLGSRLVLDAAESALNDLRVQGTADYSGIALHGFPSRFDITVEAPVLQTTDGQVAWSAPFFQTFALSYRPNRIIAVWPDEQTLKLRGQEIGIRTADMRASAAFGLNRSVPLDHMALVAKDGQLSSSAGWSATFDELRFATERADSPDAHRIGIALSGMKPDIEGLPAAFVAPDASPASALIDLVAGFDRPVDRFAPRDGVQVETLLVRSLDLSWGPVHVTGKGDLAVTPDGFPSGRIDLEVTGWKDLTPLLVATGILAPRLARPVDTMMQGLARSSGDPEVLALPLIFRGGRVNLGPVPVGQAPRLASG